MTAKRNMTLPRLTAILPVASLFLLSSCAPAVAQSSIQLRPGPSHPTGGADPAQALEEQGTIQVSGQARISVPADRVRISLIVETEARSAGDATQQNAQKMEAVFSAIQAMDLPGIDLETFGYVLRPEYEVSREGSAIRTISGYRTQNNLRVTTDDVDATGLILDRAVAAGANRVSNLHFEASDTRQARIEALQLAVLNAREQADAIAESMGIRLGIALEVHGGANAPSPNFPGGMNFRAAAEATTPVESGDQIVSASVTIKYRIQGGGS